MFSKFSTLIFPKATSLYQGRKTFLRQNLIYSKLKENKHPTQRRIIPIWTPPTQFFPNQQRNYTPTTHPTMCYSSNNQVLEQYEMNYSYPNSNELFLNIQ